MDAPHIDIDFMAGSMHFRPLAKVGFQTKPMELGRACSIQLRDGTSSKDVEALKAECAPRLARISAGFGTQFKGGQLVGALSGDAEAALAEIREAASRPPARA